MDPSSSQADDIVLLDAPSTQPASTAEDPKPSVVHPSTTFTSSQRIQQLNKIDKDIARLLETAGLAVQSLSQPLPTQKETFASHTKQYHSLLSSIVVNIRRQIFALEQADIQIPASVGFPGPGASTGGIDVGAITGRSDAVGRTMEAKLWREAREFVEEIVGGGGKEDGTATQGSDDAAGAGVSQVTTEGDDMQVDAAESSAKP